jgi:GTP-binding protein HflX
MVLVPAPRARVMPRAESGQKASARRPHTLHSPQDRLAEARGLAGAIDLDVADAMLVPLPQPRPATLFGSGKVEEIRLAIESAGIGLVVIDHALTPVQQRNLEKAWKTKVIDRTGLILEIFGARAGSCGPGPTSSASAVAAAFSADRARRRSSSIAACFRTASTRSSVS